MFSRKFSNFKKVWDAYPPDEIAADELKASLGGMVDSDWITNTCTIRGTIAVRALGLEPGLIGNAMWTDAKKRKYLIRVLEMDQFLRAAFGPPSWVGGAGVAKGVDASGQTVWAHPPELKGAGIIRYSDCGFSDASGHIDVYDGRGNLKGHGYPDRCRKKEVWNVCTPRANPDWQRFINYMRGTTGWDKNGRPVLPGSAVAASPATPAAPPAAVNVRRAQELLNALSAKRNEPRLNVGPADGIAGRRTAAAVQLFQQLAGLPVTGRLDAATYARLVAF